MSSDYQNRDSLEIAQDAERDLNSAAAKQGHGAGISARHAHGASDSSESHTTSMLRDATDGFPQPPNPVSTTL
jgi:hypothetical protein